MEALEFRLDRRIHCVFFVECVFGFGVSRAAAEALVGFLGGEPVGVAYSPLLPAVSEVVDGVVSLPLLRLYVSERNGVAVLMGGKAPQPSSIPEYYELCWELLENASSMGCRYVISVSGILSAEEVEDVYAASTSRRLLELAVEAGCRPYVGGRLVGVPAVLPAMAPLFGMEGICILPTVYAEEGEREAGLRAFRVVRHIVTASARD